MRVQFTPEAQNDVDEIVSYLLGTGTFAAHFVRAMDEAEAHLRRWPAAGARRYDLSSKSNVRFWLVHVWQIIYVIEQDELIVLAVLHTSRNIRRELRHRLKKA